MSDRPTREPAQDCARTIVSALLGAGVREVVLAPGSRSAPFAYALTAADRAGSLRLHVRIDERTAGFLALGLARAGGAPSAVVTTSGTAAANLFPPVLEASAAGIPLVVVTADRPAELRHSGANQTTDQVRLFGEHVRGSATIEDSWSPAGCRAEVRRLLVLATGVRTRRPGPVQLNVALSEPLAPAALRPAPAVPEATAPGPRVTAATGGPALVLPAGPRTVVVAGDAPPEVGRRIAEQCERAGVPLLAEPSSNARRGAAAIAAYRIVLRSALAAEIERVVVVGRPTLSRPVNALLGRPDVEVVVVSERADWPDPVLRDPLVADAVELPVDDSDWLRRWRAADADAADWLDALLAGDAALVGPGLARTVLAACPSDAPLVLGSSNAVRDADLAPVRDDAGPTYANRGLAGIDGTLSTAVGIALALGRPAVALVGDLTFLHDLTGLVIGPDEPRPDLRIVVANDDGGSIFATLEHGRPEYASVHERVFGTPHHADLAATVRGLGVVSERVETPDQLTEALRRPPNGLEVIEVRVDRSRRRELDAAVTALATML